MAFWEKLKGKKKKPTSVICSNVEFQEAPRPHEAVNKSRELKQLLAGRIEPLEAERAIEAFIADGWDTVNSHIRPLILGQSPGAPWVLGKIFSFFPGESAAYLDEYESSPVKILFLLMEAVGRGHERQVTDILLALLPQLDKDDLPEALELLGKFPTSEGNKLLASFLEDDDWRLVVKAASALEKAGAYEYRDQIEASAKRGGIIESSLKEILQRMS